jgi:hypothetical protein
MDDGVYVEIVPIRPSGRIQDDPGYLRLGPMSEGRAERVLRGALINLDRDRYFVRSVLALEDEDE